MTGALALAVEGVDLCLNDEPRGRPVGGCAGPKEEVVGECAGEAWVLLSVAIAARYCMTFFVFSVFPAPDSPLCRSVSMGKVGRCQADIRDQDALIFALFIHADPGTFGYCEDVRSILVSALISVLFNDCVGVEGQ